MKKLLILTFLIGMVMSQAYASSVSRVAAHLADDSMQTQAMETDRGRFVPIEDVVTKKKIGAKQLMSSPQIQLRNGEVLYPEEVSYLIIEKQKDSAVQIQRVPRDHN